MVEHHQWSSEHPSITCWLDPFYLQTYWHSTECHQTPLHSGHTGTFSVDHIYPCTLMIVTIFLRTGSTSLVENQASAIWNFCCINDFAMNCEYSDFQIFFSNVSAWGCAFMHLPVACFWATLEIIKEPSIQVIKRKHKISGVSALLLRLMHHCRWHHFQILIGTIQ